MDTDDAPVAYNFIKGNSRKVKVTLPEFVLDLCVLVINIVYKF